LSPEGPRIEAVIPLKDPALGKTRLASALTPAVRAQLVTTMLAQVSACLHGVARLARVHVLTSEWRSVPERCSHLADDGLELNAAIARAAQQLAQSGVAQLLVIAADLPLIDARSIEALLDCAAPDRVVAAADWTGRGTNALLWSPAHALEPRFGPESLRAHAASARRLGLSFSALEDPQLAFDLDEPAQLPELLRARPAQYAFLGAPARRESRG